MNNYLKFYINIIPLYSLVAVVGGIFRQIFLFPITEYLLQVYFVLDLLLVFSCLTLPKRFRVYVLFYLFFLLIPLFSGLFNFEISRRHFTDFMLPILFLTKSLVFYSVLSKNDFIYILRKWSLIMFYGSLILLPIVYYYFRNFGSSRLAIFAPLEIPLGYFISSGSLIVSILILGMAVLYGKRAQFLALFLAIVLVLFKRKRSLITVFTLLVVGLSVVNVFELDFSSYKTVNRLTNSVEMIADNPSDFKEVSSGRDVEIEFLYDKISFSTLLIGLGCGMSYIIPGTYKEIGNVHFSPLSLLSKYGVFFSVLFYILMVFTLYKSMQILRHGKNNAYALIFIMLFVESFFAYNFFVTPYYPLVIAGIWKFSNLNE